MRVATTSGIPLMAVDRAMMFGQRNVCPYWLGLGTPTESGFGVQAIGSSFQGGN